MTESAKKEASVPAKQGAVYKKAIAVMTDMEALGKGRRNTQQGYNFRGIDDVYNMVQPIMAKHGLIMSSYIMEDRSEERASKGGGVLIYRILKIRYSLIAEDGSSIITEVIGEGMDSGDKATNKAMSVAQKYAILQMFMIPTEEPKDPENDSPDPKPKAQSQPKAGPKDEPKAEPKTEPGPMTDEQAKKIMDLVTAFQAISKRTDKEMADAINKRVQAKYGVTIKGLKDLTYPMAETVIASLKKWGKDLAESLALMKASVDAPAPGPGAGESHGEDPGA